MMATQMSDEAWLDSYMVEAIEFLSEKYDVKAPSVVMNCEMTCPWAGECHYLACYMPWNNHCNFKSGSEKGQIASHEFVHHLQTIGIVEESGEGVAVDMEGWWLENVSSLSCEKCGAPLFADEDMVGADVVCDECGAVHEVVNVQGYPDPGGVIVSKNTLMFASVVVPMAGVIFGSFVFDALPKEGLGAAENEKRMRRVVGETALAGFIGGAAYTLIKKTPEPEP